MTASLNPGNSPGRSLADLLRALRDGDLEAVDLAAACLARIAAEEPEIRAFVHLDPAGALARARALDASRKAGKPPGPLHGLPVGVKDIIDTADMPTAYGSPLHEGRRPGTDAALVTRLRQAGAVIIGKTVTSEFATFAAGPTRNPHDKGRTPGGSSSGSAAAVASGMVPAALATQTNGSIIRPASYCGIVGFKPSFGLLPRTGILPQAELLDQPGFMTTDVQGAAVLLAALTEPGLLDASHIGSPALPRLAFVPGPYWDQVSPASRALIEAFVRSLGPEVERLDLPKSFAEASPALGDLLMHGLATELDVDYRRGRALMSPILVDLIERGQSIGDPALARARRLRETLRQEFAAIAAPFDALITAATTHVAGPFEAGTGDPILASIWTFLGAPSLSLPGLTLEGMPLGLQLVGREQGDADLLAAATWLEKRLSHWQP
ncbi:Asp-tRNAAsn/Glu-tRNAGln amidotransferase A subunit [Arboricoccus pini]|uniref:Asp-tRNAAsn/Glu-tRNAGln amidotransferase A subunit n=1 Tax=Arboricoccus pini TaxID=1963835 RepID=A0A212RKQ2_9PROT|nr:amidase [Arboricoccus pini]SNB73039.1 Asp-tRNAAsn/Glu-tRNAGln amidotransferase A subunit [Arboricoccus pini]